MVSSPFSTSGFGTWPSAILSLRLFLAIISTRHHIVPGFARPHSLFILFWRPSDPSRCTLFCRSILLVLLVRGSTILWVIIIKVHYAVNPDAD